MKKDRGLIWTSIFTAVGASLCCIIPVLALISGASGIASSISWLEPLRPYLIGITVLVLVTAWYQKLKPKKDIDCDCETTEKPKFIQSKAFLLTVTVFATLMLAFPYYGSIFYPKPDKGVITTDIENIQKIYIEINGMTCNTCEEYVNHTIGELDGIISVESSFENGSSRIEFDNSKTNVEEIEAAINSTGYTVINTTKE